MRRFYYLQSLILVFCIPSIIAGYFLSGTFSFQQLAVFVLVVTLVGSIWDVWAARHGPKDTVWLWQFHHSQTLGITFLDLPIEEYLFYVASSVYVVLMWEGIKEVIAGDAGGRIYFIIPALGLWTLTSILLPYFWGPKGDRFIK